MAGGGTGDVDAGVHRVLLICRPTVTNIENVLRKLQEKILELKTAANHFWLRKKTGLSGVAQHSQFPLKWVEFDCVSSKS